MRVKLVLVVASLLMLGLVAVANAQQSVSYGVRTYRGVPIVCGESYVVDTWLVAKLVAPNDFEWFSAVWTWEEGENPHKFDRDNGHGSHAFAWFSQPDQIGEPYFWRVLLREKDDGPTVLDCTFTITRT